MLQDFDIAFSTQITVLAMRKSRKTNAIDRQRAFMMRMTRVLGLLGKVDVDNYGRSPGPPSAVIPLKPPEAAPRIIGPL